MWSAASRSSRVNRVDRAVWSCGERRFGTRRFEQLDWIAAGVVEEDLFAADAGHDVVAEVGAGVSKRPHRRCEIRDFEHESVPASGLGVGSVWHRLAAAATGAWCAENEAEVVAFEHRECRGGVHLFGETEMCAVERDRGV